MQRQPRLPAATRSKPAPPTPDTFLSTPAPVPAIMDSRPDRRAQARRDQSAPANPAVHVQNIQGVVHASICAPCLQSCSCFSATNQIRHWQYWQSPQLRFRRFPPSPRQPQSWLLSDTSQTRATGMHLECHGKYTRSAWEVHGKCKLMAPNSATASLGCSQVPYCINATPASSSPKERAVNA